LGARNDADECEQRIAVACREGRETVAVNRFAIEHASDNATYRTMTGVTRLGCRSDPKQLVSKAGNDPKSGQWLKGASHRQGRIFPKAGRKCRRKATRQFVMCCSVAVLNSFEKNTPAWRIVQHVAPLSCSKDSAVGRPQVPDKGIITN